MPNYEFLCEKGHRTERRAGLDDSELPCPKCGRVARRIPFYADQYIIGETVAKGGFRSQGNVKDKRGRVRVSLFQEACQEIEYAHGRTEQDIGKALPYPNLYKEGVRRADEVRAGRRAPPKTPEECAD